MNSPNAFLLHLSAILIVFMLGFLLIRKPKNVNQIHYSFLFMFIFMFFEVAGFYLGINKSLTKTATIITYTGVIFLSLSILFTGIIFAHTKIRIKKYYLLFIGPIINFLVLLTNDYHHLFFIKYSVYPSDVAFGKYFVIHALFSYTYVVVGLSYLVYFSIKNSGFFSSQAIVVTIGSVIPLITNILVYLTKTIPPQNSDYLFEISFTFTIFCFWFAITKYKFLNVAPIALQTIVDQISDGFIIVDEYHSIIDYNQPFVNIFSKLYTVKRKDSLLNFLSTIQSSGTDEDNLTEAIEKAIENKHPVCLSHHINIKLKKFNRHFTIEITPIFSKGNFIGTIILFKDITEIKNSQAILMEKERLASLGEMIGGIAHNLRTPIMALSGGIEALNDLIAEYDESVEDDKVTAEDHHQIAREMLGWTEKMGPYLSYMSDIITAVKGQAVQFNESSHEEFTLEELVKRIELLMKHNLRKNNIKYRTSFEMDMNTELKGEINNLVQVFNNLINNAIDAYEERGGEVEFSIHEEENKVIFKIRDFGCGIPDDVQQNLMKSMITTKGKKGTGLGLYMSYATIKGKFGGEMWFESEVGTGTTFLISIPLNQAA